MDTKTFIAGALAVTFCAILLMGVMFPSLGTMTQEETKTETYHNTGSAFAFTDDLGTTHTMNIAQDGDTYTVTTDDSVSRAIDCYIPATRGIASALGIGVYEAYNNNGVLTSQSGVLSTTTQTVDEFRDLALAGNTDVTKGTYQLWNFYQYTLTKIMGFTIMGNTDSQYMMGPGVTGGSKVQNGTTNSAYYVSTTGSIAECLFIENMWGNVNEFVGDVNLYNHDVRAGNTLGGHGMASVVNTFGESVRFPTTNTNSIKTIYMSSDSFGIPKSGGNRTDPGKGINDVTTQESGYTTFGIGGRWTAGASGGMSCVYANNPFDYSADRFGTRLAYVVTDEHDSADYGYRIYFSEANNQTTIYNVQIQKDGEWIDAMPNGTNLNPAWAFDPTTGKGPFGSYYAAINLASGDNNDDLTAPRLSKQKGEIAYILDPANLHQTLGGFTFNPALYNVMLIVPTAYWYCDPDSKVLYVGSSPDRFEGITMRAYAHEYTIDPNVDTGNPVKPIYYESIPLAIGDKCVVMLYENGDISLIRESSTINIGNAQDGISLGITGNVLTYPGGSQDGMIMYAVMDGEIVECTRPTILNDTPIWIGGEHETKDGKIGYEGAGTISAINPTPLDPSEGYVSTTVNIEKDTLESGASIVDLTISTEWESGTVPHQYNIITSKDITVTYTEGGASGTFVKIALAIAVLVAAGLLIFAVKILYN